jgi:type I restriction enzyme S subunit
VTDAALGDVAEFINGAAFKPEDWNGTGARIIRIQNLTDPSKPFNRTSRQVPAKYEVHPGTLLVSWSASLGVFEWNEPDTALLNQHIFKVVPDPEKVKQAYLRHMLVKSLADMTKYAHGSTMMHVNRGEFLSTRIPLPPLAEQQRIAAILDQADALHRKRVEVSAELGRLRQAIFSAAIEVSNSNGGPTSPLGEHLSFVTSGGRNWSRYYSDAGARFIRSYDVQMGSIADDEMIFVTPPNNAEARRTGVKAGDVLLTITGSRIGRVSPISQELAGSYVSQHVAILRPKAGLLPAYLSAFLRLPNGGQKAIAKMQYGQTKPGLNFDQIRKFSIPVPPMPTQERIVDHLHQIDTLDRTNACQLKALDALFASLQHRAFRGEL